MVRLKIIKSWPVFIAQLATLIVILALTEYLVKKGIIGDLYLASPSQTFQELVLLFQGKILFQHLAATLKEFVLGMMLAVIFGIGMGLVIARFKSFESFIGPYLSALMAIPKVAIIPLLMIWFGIGLLNKVILVFLFSFFPVCYNTITGVKNTPENYLKVARVFRANPLQLTFKLFLPSAMPTIFAGLRVGASSGFVGAIFGEMMASKEGLGNLLISASQLYKTGQVFAIILITTVISVLIIYGIDCLERKVFLRWKYEK